MRVTDHQNINHNLKLSFLRAKWELCKLSVGSALRTHHGNKASLFPWHVLGTASISLSRPFCVEIEEHMKAPTKCLSFCRQHFQVHFIE